MILSGKDEQFAFQRALSRLREMTSESYARDEQWTPLPPSARKWETSQSPTQSPSPSPPQSSFPPPHRNFKARSDDAAPVTGRPSSDFAEEASAHATHPHPHPTARPPAPRLRADHVWGVREDWGAQAREWGRGASVYSQPEATPRVTSTSPPTGADGETKKRGPGEDGSS